MNLADMMGVKAMDDDKAKETMQSFRGLMSQQEDLFSDQSFGGFFSGRAAQRRAAATPSLPAPVRAAAVATKEKQTQEEPKEPQTPDEPDQTMSANMDKEAPQTPDQPDSTMQANLDKETTQAPAAPEENMGPSDATPEGSAGGGSNNGNSSGTGVGSTGGDHGVGGSSATGDTGQGNYHKGGPVKKTGQAGVQKGEFMFDAKTASFIGADKLKQMQSIVRGNGSQQDKWAAISKLFAGTGSRMGRMMGAAGR